MKPLIKVVASVVMAAWTWVASADQGIVPPTQTAPTLTWNRIALEAVERAKPTQHQAIRLLTYVSLAQYAAVNADGTQGLNHDAVATASMKVIAALLPSQAAFVEGRHREHQLRDSANGDRIAQGVLAQAQVDGFMQPWEGRAPQAAYAWRNLGNPSAPPAYPAIGGMRMFVADSGSAFRPAPPPALGSQRFLDDLAEVRRYSAAPTEESTRIAKFYDMTTGTLAGGFWNEQAADLIRADTLQEAQAATVLATVNAAMMDAVVACHDAKYAYWVPRPSQADPSIEPLIGVPNHPSYPSNHSCISTTAALVLAYFFPQHRQRLEAIAAEAGISRIYAGIHYRFDVNAGEEIGRKLAATAVARHREMLSSRTQTLLAANR